MRATGADHDGEYRRVFLALWPDEAIREALFRLAGRLDVGGRSVPREHLHLTLAFPGTIEANRVDCLLDRLAGFSFAAIPLQLDQLGHFSAAKVTWLGPANPPQALGELADRVTELCRVCGIETEGRPFRPHITLRRCSRPAAQTVLDPPLHWRAEMLVLVESGRGGHPGPYRLLAQRAAS